MTFTRAFRCRDREAVLRMHDTNHSGRVRIRQRLQGFLAITPVGTGWEVKVACER